MEDLSYYTKAVLGLADVAAVAAASGYRCRFHTHVYPLLNIHYTPEDFWQWSEMRAEDGDFDSLEAPQQEKVRVYQPASAFLISYHVNSLPQLVAFLEQVLRRWGGWVGCDDGTFETTYDAANIKTLRYP